MTKTDIARIYRDCYGAPRFGEGDYLFAKAIERFVSAKIEAENAALVDALEGVIDCEETDSEYDGQSYSIFTSCGANDLVTNLQHRAGCWWEKAKEALAVFKGEK